MEKKLTTAALVFGLAVITSVVSTHAESLGATFNDCPECGDMVVIPAGQFLMGSGTDPSGKHVPDDEKPQHSVSIKSFAIGKYEVTQAQWSALMSDNRSPNKGPTLPVQRVSWNTAHEFIDKLNAKTGLHYRLPTEAEWEYAARAGSTTLYSFGDEATQLANFAWFGGIGGNSEKKTHPIGEKLPNQFGLHDMHGNVWEWVEDCYIDSYANAPNDGSAVAGPACDSRGYRDYVFRGGSYDNVPGAHRSASRRSLSPGYASEDVGLRLAKPLP